MSKKNAKMVIVSYPKSGRTWLRILLEWYREFNGMPMPQIFWTHLGYGHDNASAVNKFLHSHRDVPRVLLTRDLADSLVSYYHDDMFRNPSRLTGCSDINDYVKEHVTHIQEFYHKANELNYQYQLSYEEMHHNTEETVAPIIELIMGEVNHEALKNAVRECEFSNLQRSERAGRVDMRVDKKHMSRGFYKTRKGKIGSAKEELNADTYEWLQKEIKSKK